VLPAPPRSVRSVILLLGPLVPCRLAQSRDVWLPEEPELLHVPTDRSDNPPDVLAPGPLSAPVATNEELCRALGGNV
jgi:hypothetical protein